MTDVDGVGTVVVFYVKRVEYPVKDAVDDDSKEKAHDYRQN